MAPQNREISPIEEELRVSIPEKRQEEIIAELSEEQKQSLTQEAAAQKLEEKELKEPKIEEKISEVPKEKKEFEKKERIPETERKGIRIIQKKTGKEIGTALPPKGTALRSGLEAGSFVREDIIKPAKKKVISPATKFIGGLDFSTVGSILSTREETRLKKETGLFKKREFTAGQQTRKDFAKDKNDIDLDKITKDFEGKKAGKDGLTKDRQKISFEGFSIKGLQELQQEGFDLPAEQKGRVIKSLGGEEFIKKRTGFGREGFLSTFGGGIESRRQLAARNIKEKTEEFVEKKSKKSKKEINDLREDLTEKIRKGEISEEKANRRIEKLAKKEEEKIKKEAEKFAKKESEKKVKEIKNIAGKGEVSKAVADIPVNIAIGAGLGTAAGASRVAATALNIQDVAEVAVAVPRLRKSISSGGQGLGAAAIQIGSFAIGGAAGGKVGAKIRGKEISSSKIEEAIDRSTVVDESVGKSLEAVKDIKLPENVKKEVESAKKRGFEINVIETKLKPSPGEENLVPKTKGKFLEIKNKAGSRLELIDLGTVNVKSRGRDFNRQVLQEAKAKIDSSKSFFITKSFEGKIDTTDKVQKVTGKPTQFKVEKQFKGVGEVLGGTSALKGQAKAESSISKLREIESESDLPSQGLGIPAQPKGLVFPEKLISPKKKPQFDLDKFESKFQDITKEAEQLSAPTEISAGVEIKKAEGLVEKDTGKIQEGSGIKGVLLEKGGFSLGQKRKKVFPKLSEGIPKQEKGEDTLGKKLSGGFEEKNLVRELEKSLEKDIGGDVLTKDFEKTDLSEIIGLKKLKRKPKKPKKKTTKKTKKKQETKQDQRPLEKDLSQGIGETLRGAELRKSAKLADKRADAGLRKEISFKSGLTTGIKAKPDLKTGQEKLLSQQDNLIELSKEGQQEGQSQLDLLSQQQGQLEGQKEQQNVLESQLELAKQSELKQSLKDTTLGIRRLRSPKRIRTPLTTRIKLPKPKKRKEKKKDKFDVFVKEKGDFKRVAGPVRKRKGLDLGAYVTDKTLSAQFKLEKAKKGAKKKKPKINTPPNYFALNKNKFRDFKIKKGKKKPLKKDKKFIELQNLRLDSAGEVNEITASRFINRRKKSKNIKKGNSRDISGIDKNLGI